MKFVPIKKEDICGRAVYKYGVKQQLLLDFMASDAEAAEVTEFTNKNAYLCASVLGRAIKRLRIGCKASVRDGHVYLIKTITNKIG